MANGSGYKFVNLVTRRLLNQSVYIHMYSHFTELNYITNTVLVS